MTPIVNGFYPQSPDFTVEPDAVKDDRYAAVIMFYGMFVGIFTGKALTNYERETAGDFEAAIGQYRRAAELARCDCERAHADAGVQAAEEAAALRDKDGMATRPTQLFWARLRELTQGLPCVRVQA